jgi:hypothetical protein
LAILFGFFSGGAFINSYYTAALIPAEAALCAAGLATAWRTRANSRISRIVLLLVMPASTAYAVWLIPPESGIGWWLRPTSEIVCVIAEGVLAVSVRRNGLGQYGGGLAVSMGALSVLLPSAVTAGLVVADGLGSFSTPYQSAAATAGTTTGPEHYQRQNADAAAYYRGVADWKIVQVVDTGALAAPIIMVTGREFLPVGGYSGENPSPSLARLRQLVRTHQVQYFLIPVSPAGTDPRMAWVRSQCTLEATLPWVRGVQLGRYECGVPRSFPLGRPNESTQSPLSPGGVGSAAAEALADTMEGNLGRSNDRSAYKYPH